MLESLLGASHAHRLEPLLLTQSRRGQTNLSQDVPIVSSSGMHFIKKLLGQTRHDTLNHFLSTTQKGLGSHLLNHKSVLILDQAQRLSFEQLKALTDHASNKQLRLILLGDEKSGGSIGVRGYDMLHTGGTRTLSANDQYTPREQQAKNVQSLFTHKIGERVIEIAEQASREEALADHYLSLGETLREKTTILAPTLAGAGRLNQTIANSRAAKSPDTAPLAFGSLQPVFLKSEDAGNAKHYQVGQLLRVNEDFLRARLRKGQYYRIDSIDHNNQRVQLQTAKGDLRRIELAKFVGKDRPKVELFDEKALAVTAGERLQVTRTDYSKSLTKGDYLTIESINHQRLVAIDEGGKRIKLDMRSHDARHLRYGYAQSVLSDDATRKADQVLAMMDGHSRFSDQKRAYDLIHRAKQVSIYTNDATALLMNVAERTGERPTALQSYLQAEQKGVSTEQLAYPAMIRELIERELTHIQGNESLKIETAQEAVSYAIAHLSEREAAFEHRDVLQTALTFALGDVKPDEIEQKVLAAQKSGELIAGAVNYEGKWTTRLALDRERQVVFNFLKDQNKLTPLIASSQLEKSLNETQPYDSHRSVLENWLSSKNRMDLLEGLAGTGKTTLLVDANKMLKPEGYDLLTLAPTHGAVKALKQKGLQAMTMARFLAEAKRDEARGIVTPTPNRVVVVDENSLSGTVQSLDFMNSIHARGARAFYMGNKDQHSPVSAGDDHRLLQVLGIRTLSLTDIHRQQRDWYKSVVKSAYAHDYASVIKKLGDKVIENQAIAQSTAREYTKLPERLQREVLIMTPGNDLRREINYHIREALSARGQIIGQEQRFPQLVSKSMTETEMGRALNYKAGDILHFSLSDREAGIQSDRYLTVTDIHREQNALTLNDGKRDYFWKARAEGIEAFQKREIAIKQGDRVMWTRSDPKREQFAAQMMQVSGVHANGMDLIPDDQSQTEGQVDAVMVDMRDKHFWHIDHGYGITSRRGQGLDENLTLWAVPSSHPHLTHQKDALVSITRGKIDLRVITDDKKQLVQTLSEQTGVKTTAIEVSGRTDRVKAYIAKQQASQGITTDELGEPVKRHKPIQPSAAPPRLFDKDRIHDALNVRAEEIAEMILGTPRKSTTRELRFGSNKGSLVLTRTGQYRGHWRDFSSDEHGTMLSLIAKHEGLRIKEDYKLVLEKAVNILGLSPESMLSVQRINTQSSTAGAKYEAQVEAATKEAKQTAQSIWMQTSELKGTLGERYLKEHRGIDRTDKLAVRFLEANKTWQLHQDGQVTDKANKVPALVTVAKDAKGEVSGVQLIYLDRQTANKNRWMDDAKISRGRMKGAGGVVQQGKDNDTVVLVEGTETGGSLARVYPKATVLNTFSAGNFANLTDLLKSLNVKHALIAADNDPGNRAVQMSLSKAVLAYEKAGIDTSIIYPKAFKGQSKPDWNDILQHKGIEGLKRQVKAQLTAMGQTHVDFAKIEKQVQKELLRDEKLAENGGKHFTKPTPDELATLVQAKALSVQRGLAHGDKRFEQYRGQGIASRHYLAHQRKHQQQQLDAARLSQQQQQLANASREMSKGNEPVIKPPETEKLPNYSHEDRERSL